MKWNGILYSFSMQLRAFSQKKRKEVVVAFKWEEISGCVTFLLLFPRKKEEGKNLFKWDLAWLKCSDQDFFPTKPLHLLPHFFFFKAPFSTRRIKISNLGSKLRVMITKLKLHLNFPSHENKYFSYASWWIYTRKTLFCLPSLR